MFFNHYLCLAVNPALSGATSVTTRIILSTACVLFGYAGVLRGSPMAPIIWSTSRSFQICKCKKCNKLGLTWAKLSLAGFISLSRAFFGYNGA